MALTVVSAKRRLIGAGFDFCIGDGIDTFGDYNGTDESPIQAAVDALPNGGTIYIRRGTYVFTQSLVLPDKPYFFYGDGDELTVLKRITDIAMIPMHDNLTVEMIEFENGLPGLGNNGVLNYTGTLNKDLKDINIRFCSFRQKNALSMSAWIRTTETKDSIRRMNVENNLFISGLLTSGSGQLNPFLIQGQERVIATADRTANVATIVTTTPHGYIVGDSVYITQVSPDLYFSGVWTITSVPTTTSFTYAQPGLGDTAGSTGGGAHVGGLFLESKFCNNYSEGGGAMIRIFRGGSASEISHNVTKESAGPGGGTGSITVDSCDGMVITNNSISECEHPGIMVGLGGGGCANSRIENNFVVGQVGGGIICGGNGATSGSFFSASVNNNHITGNVSTSSDALVFRNQKDAAGAIISELKCQNNHIINGTGYGLSFLNALGAGLSNGSTRCHIWGNISYGSITAGVFPAAITFDTGVGNTSIFEKNMLAVNSAAY